MKSTFLLLAVASIAIPLFDLCRYGLDDEAEIKWFQNLTEPKINLHRACVASFVMFLVAAAGLP